MATKDRNGALHSEENGQFVSKGDSDNVVFDVEKLEKQSRGQPASIIPGKGEPADNPDNLPKLKKTVNPGRESKSSEAYGNRIKTEFGMSYVDISRIDPECAADVYEGLRKCFSKYPKMREFIKVLVYNPELKKTAHWNLPFKEIALGRIYGNAKAFSEAYSQERKKGTFPSGTTHATVIAHEFAHALDDYMSKKISQDYSASICERLLGGNIKNANEISGYAIENPREMFAEAFHEWMVNGEETCTLTTKIMEIFREEFENDTGKN